MSERLPQLALAGPRGCVGRAMLAYMKREHPEVRVIPVYSSPFAWEKTLRPLLIGGPITHFVNCVGLGRNSESIQAPVEYYETNSIGVLRQLESIRQLSPHTRYVNLGTIYEASADLGVAGTPYSSSKRVARDMVATYRQQYDLHASTATLGFTEYYGRHESFLSRRIAMGVAKIARAIKRGESFEPLELRDIQDTYHWTWAEDVAARLWHILNRDKPEDELVADTSPHSVYEFAAWAFAQVGLSGWTTTPQGYVTPSGHLIATSTTTRAPVHQDYVSRYLLNWKPTTTFPQLVERMVKYDLDLLDNPPRAPQWPA